jgi:hypothetical protein
LVTREKLHQLVWSKPMTKVAEQFGVSGSYLARVCSTLRVPRPERGYWAKLDVGKAPAIPSLPEAQPGDPLDWSKDGELRGPPRIHKRIAVRPTRRLSPTAPITGVHMLIKEGRTHFESGRPVDDGAYLKPYKKLLVDITTSKTGLDKALTLANEIFNALESTGFKVAIAHSGEPFGRRQVDQHEIPQKRQDYYRSLWSPGRPTVVYVGSVAIGLALVEMSESVLMRYVRGKYIRDSDYIPPKPSRHFVDHTWTTTQDVPSGRFRLVAYAPYYHVSWSTHWQETAKASLAQQFPAIVRAMKGIAVDLSERVAEADRQSEIARRTVLAEEERRRRVEDQRRTHASKKESQEHLDQIIEAWGNVMNVERFFQGVQEQATNLPASDRGRVLSRLALAREFVGSQNPLEFFLAWKAPLELYQSRYPDETTVREAEDYEPLPVESEALCGAAPGAPPAQ